VRSITGHSMGGNGSLLIAGKNPDLFRSVSAFAPICNASNEDSKFTQTSFSHYFAGNPSAAKEYDCSEVIKNAKKLPVGLIDFGTHDEYLTSLRPHTLIEALG
jgi:S-formylglutathione hydrolase